MDSAQYKKITDRYKQTSGLVLGTREVMGRLIGALILNMEQAKGAHSQKRLDAMCEFNRKSLRILGAIRRSLEDGKIDACEQVGMQLLLHLRHFYKDIFIRLANVVRANNPQAEFDLLLSRMKQQYHAWHGNSGKITVSAPSHIIEQRPSIRKTEKTVANFYT